MRRLYPLLLLAFASPALAAPAPTITPVFRSNSTVDGKPIRLPEHPDIIVTRVTIPPGARLPVHKHLYQRYAYVLSGDIRLVNEETGATRESHTGDFLVELRDTWHTGVAIGDRPVELLVMDHVPAGLEKNVILRP